MLVIRMVLRISTSPRVLVACHSFHNTRPCCLTRSHPIVGCVPRCMASSNERVDRQQAAPTDTANGSHEAAEWRTTRSMVQLLSTPPFPTTECRSMAAVLSGNSLLTLFKMPTTDNNNSSSNNNSNKMGPHTTTGAADSPSSSSFTGDFSYEDMREAFRCVRYNLRDKLRANGFAPPYPYPGGPFGPWDHRCGPWSHRPCRPREDHWRRRHQRDDKSSSTDQTPLVAYRWSEQEMQLRRQLHRFRRRQFGGGIAGALVAAGGWTVISGGSGFLATGLASVCGLVGGRSVAFFSMPKSSFVEVLTIPDEQSKLSKFAREILEEQQPDNPFYKRVQARLQEKKSSTVSNAKSSDNGSSL